MTMSGLYAIETDLHLVEIVAYFSLNGHLNWVERIDHLNSKLFWP